MKNVDLKTILVASGLVLFFGLAFLALPLNDLIIVLNGMFAGSLVAFVYAFWGLIVNAFNRYSPYTAKRQLMWGIVLMWLAYVVSVASSIELRASGVDGAALNSSYLIAISRASAIMGIFFQVTAPDFGLPMFYGRDRKVLWSGLIIGFAISVFMIYAQVNDILEGAVAWALTIANG